MATTGTVMLQLIEDARVLGSNGRKNCPAIRECATGPLILIKTIGSIRWANNGPNKDRVVAAYNEEAGDILLWIWPGKFRSDVFQITREDLVTCYDVEPASRADVGRMF